MLALPAGQNTDRFCTTDVCTLVPFSNCLHAENHKKLLQTRLHWKKMYSDRSDHILWGGYKGKLLCIGSIANPSEVQMFLCFQMGWI